MASYIERNRVWAEEYLRTHPCADCGEDDWIVLEFDHVRGTKTYCVAAMVGKGSAMSSLIEEVAKCDVVCANCHRRRTYARSPNWRTTWIPRG